MSHLSPYISNQINNWNSTLLDTLISIPTPSTYLERLPEYCKSFSAKFPSKIVHSSPEKNGIFKATYQVASYFFRNLIPAFSNQIPPVRLKNERQEILIEKDLQKLKIVETDLNDLENRIFYSHVLPKVSVDAFLSEIKKLRENLILFRGCPPEFTLEEEAVEEWSQNVQSIHIQAKSLISKFFKSTVTNQHFSDSSCKPIQLMVNQNPSLTSLENFMKALDEKGVGLPLKQGFPSDISFLSTLYEMVSPVMLKGTEKDNNLLKEIKSAIEFHQNVFSTFNSDLSKGKFQRFLLSSKEFDPIFSKHLLNFQNEIKRHLDRTESSSFIIPIAAVERASIFNLSKNISGKTQDEFLNLVSNKKNYHLLRVFKQENNSAILRVYSSNPEEQFKIQGTPYFNPYQEYQITHDQLTDPNFLAELLEITREAAKLPPLREFNYSEFLSKEGLSNYLGVRAKEFAESAVATFFDPAMDQATPQTLTSVLDKYVLSPVKVTFNTSDLVLSGEANNPWNAWQTLLQGDGYEPLFLDIKMASLIRIGQILESHELTEEQFYIVKAFLLELGQKAALEHQNQKISDAKLGFIVAHLEEISHKLSRFEEEKLAKLKFDEISSEPLTGNTCKKFVHVPEFSPSKTDVPTQIHNFHSVREFANWTPNPINVSSDLNTFINELNQAYKEDNYNGIICSVKNFYRNFNLVTLEDSFWSSLPPEAAEKILLSLRDINQIYFKSYFDADVPRLPDLESGLIMMESLTLTNLLLKKLPTETKLNDYEVDVSAWKPYIENRSMFFRSGNPEIDLRVLKTREVFEGNPRADLFKVNLAPAPRSNVFSILGGELHVPNMVLHSSHYGMAITYSDQKLIKYLINFRDEFDQKFPHFKNIYQTEKFFKLYSGEVNLLPSSFYAVRDLKFISDYFLTGPFLKPSNFNKTADSYHVKYRFTEASKIAPLYADAVRFTASTAVDKELSLGVIQAQVEGIDTTVLQENPSWPNGLTQGHQFQHTQREVTDPVVKQIMAPYWHKKLDPWTSILGSTDCHAVDIMCPGISDVGRASYDINTVILKNADELKKYLSTQDFQILFSLRGEPGVQIANTLSFFRERPHLLEIPDLKEYFLNLLFDPPLLTHELSLSKRGPELEKQLGVFTSHQFFIAKSMGNTEKMAFFLELALRLEQYSLFARKHFPSSYSDQMAFIFHSEKKIPEIFLEAKNHAKQILQAVPTDHPSFGALHGSLALSYLNQPSLNSDGAKAFLQHVLNFSIYPPSGHLSYFLKENIQNLLQKFAPDIEREVKIDSNFLYETLKGIVPLPEKAIFLPHPNHSLAFTLENSNLFVDLTRGVVSGNQIDKSPLPYSGLNSLVYTSLFGAKEYLAKAITTSTFEFIDEAGQTYRLIRDKNNEYQIQRQFIKEGRKVWYQYILQNFQDKLENLSDSLQNFNDKFNLNLNFPNLPLLLEKDNLSENSILPSQALVDGTTHWYNPDTPAEILILNSEGRLRYRASLIGLEAMKHLEPRKLLQEVYRLDHLGKDAYSLVSLPNSPFQWVSNFDDLSHVLVWKDLKNERPQLIEFPRFGDEGLTFKWKDQHFESIQFPGYFLKPIQNNPISANTSNFLILKNHNGDEKLLIPRQKLLEKSSLFSKLEFDRKNNEKGIKHPYFVFEKGKNDREFTSRDAEANYYLALVSSASKNYKSALSLMRKHGDPSNPLTSGEKEILKLFKNLNRTVKDNSPQMASTQLLADLIRWKNIQDQIKNDPTRKEILQKELDDLFDSQLIDHYFSASQTLGALRLSIEEELQILQAKGVVNQYNENRVKSCLNSGSTKSGKLLALLASPSLDKQQQIESLLEECKASSKIEVIRSPNALKTPPVLEDHLKFFHVSNSEMNRNHLKENLHKVFEQPLQSKVFETLPHREMEAKALNFYKKDCDSYINNRDSSFYTIKDLPGFVAKREYLQNVDRYYQDTLLHMEFQILRLADKRTDNPEKRLYEAAQRLGQMEKGPDLGNLIYLFMHKNIGSYSQFNPNLDLEDLKKLETWIDQYLEISIHHAHIQSVIKKMLDVESLVANSSQQSNDQGVNLAIQAFIEEVEKSRQFNPHDHPFLKVFEYHNRFYYRNNQIKNLEKFGLKLQKGKISASQLDSLILEMMVGQGKTTVLIPTKGFWSADGDRLSIAVMPESLIGNMSKEVERIMGKTFSQKVRRLVISRSTDLSSENLKGILDLLNQIREQRQFLIMSDKSVKALYNQFVRTLRNQDRVSIEEYKNRVQLFSEILRLFKEKGDVLLDEADLALDPRRELNFPAGSAHPIDDEFLAMAIEVYRILTSPKITNLVNFQFLEKTSKGDHCTPQAYQTLKAKLADEIIDLLASNDRKIDSRLLPFRKYYQSLDANRKEQLLHYFNDKDKGQTAETWLKELQEEKFRDLFGYIKGALNRLLPLTLKKNFGEGYGFHTSDSLIADPYSASNAPTYGSQFSDPFERVHYTIQSHYAKGISRQLIEKMVLNLRSEALTEINQNLDKIKNTPIKEEMLTKAHEKFRHYIGSDSPKLFDENAINVLFDRLKDNEEAKFDLIMRYVLPQIKVYDQNLKATSQAISFVFDRIYGCTGTLWNGATFKDSFKLDFQDGARGEILALVYQKAKGKVHEIHQSQGDPAEVLIKDPRFDHLHVYIDAGGAFKKMDLNEVTKARLEHLKKIDPKLRGAIVFDVHDRPIIFEEGHSEPILLEASTCPINERITLYDQKHTVGADIKQAINAGALVTVREGMIMRDFIQALGRMRQLASGQGIEIAIFEKDAATIREVLGLSRDEPLDIEEIFIYMIRNEVVRQSEDNEVATSDKLRAVIQEWFLKKILAVKGMKNSFGEFRTPEFIDKLFYQQVKISPFFNYGQNNLEMDTKEAFKNEIHQILNDDLKNLIRRDPFLNEGNGDKVIEHLEKEMGEAIKLENLPTKINKVALKADREEQQEIQQEQAQQQEQQQEQQQQQEVNQEKIFNVSPDTHEYWELASVNTIEKTGLYLPEKRLIISSYFLKNEKSKYDPIFTPANQAIALHKELGELQHLFDPNFLITSNQLPKNGEIFGQFHKPLLNLMIVQNKNNGEFKVIGLEPYDAVTFKNLLLEKQKQPILEKDPYLGVKNLPFGSYQDKRFLDFFSFVNNWHCLEEGIKYDCIENERGQYLHGGYKLNKDKTYYDYLRKISQSDDARIWIGDLEGYSLCESDDQIPKNLLENDPQLQKLLVQAKFFNGQIQYNDKEREVLKKWLMEHLSSKSESKIQSIQRLEEAFTKVILSFKEISKREYPFSPLKTIFEEIYKEAA